MGEGQLKKSVQRNYLAFTTHQTPTIFNYAITKH